jgi:hypothetical protein
VANLTWLEIINGVLRHGFNEGDRVYAQAWAADYYRRTWDLVDWPFKTPDLGALTITANDPTPAMPADAARVLEILNDNRDPLMEISQEAFDDAGYSDTGSTGKPHSYWMQGHQPVLGPIPDGAYDYFVRYERGVTHRDNAGAYVAGVPTLDDDYLFWDGYEHVIIFGARAIGKVATYNPTGAEDQNQADAMLLDMMSAWFPPGGAPVTFGRDKLGGF